MTLAYLCVKIKVMVKLSPTERIVSPTTVSQDGILIGDLELSAVKGAAFARARIIAEGGNPDQMKSGNDERLLHEQTTVGLTVAGDTRKAVDDAFLRNARLTVAARHIVDVAALRNRAEEGGIVARLASFELFLKSRLDRYYLGTEEGAALRPDGIVDKTRSILLGDI